MISLIPTAHTKFYITSLQQGSGNIDNFDIVIAATTSSKYISQYGLKDNIISQRKGKLFVAVDISVPRNIDPRLENIENGFLFDIDDLDKVMEEKHDIV